MSGNPKLEPVISGESPRKRLVGGLERQVAVCDGADTVCAGSSHAPTGTAGKLVRWMTKSARCDAHTYTGTKTTRWHMRPFRVGTEGQRKMISAHAWVPEPASLGPLGFSGLLMLRRRRVAR
jgi:hypothetical protein